MTDFNLSIYAADKVFYKGQCQSLVIPTPIGQYGVLANHRNLICAVSPGKINALIDGKSQEAIVSTGLLKIEDGQVLILVDSCERPEDIDEKRALRAKQEAERKLAQKMSIREYQVAQANLSRAINRLKNSRKKKTTI